MNELKEFLIKYKYIFMIMVGIILLFCRNAYNLRYPIMYAEDGVWLSDIMQNGLGWSILNSRSDYYVLILALMLKLADFIDIIAFNANLKYIPYIITIISYIFVTLVAILPSLTLGKRVNKFGKLFLYFGILLLPMGLTNTEILGRILQSHFYMWIITFCLLIYRYDNKEKRNLLIIITDLLLICCIATFPSVLVLILGYALIELYDILKRNFFENKKGKLEKRISFNKIKQAFVIEIRKRSIRQMISFFLVVFILGMMLIIKMKNSDMTFEEGGNASNIIEFLVRGISYIFIWPFYDFLNVYSGSIILLITIIAYILGYFIVSKKNRKFYLITLLSMFVITLITLITRYHLTNHLAHFTIRTVPDRYYILMNMTSLFPISVIISDGIKLKKKIVSIVAITMVLYFTIILVFNYKEIFQFENNRMVWLSGISFEDRLQASYDNNVLNEDKDAYIVDIDPWWQMEVPLDRMYKSVYR